MLHLGPMRGGSADESLKDPKAIDVLFWFFFHFLRIFSTILSLFTRSLHVVYWTSNPPKQSCSALQNFSWRSWLHCQCWSYTKYMRSVICHARLLYFNFKVLVSSRSVICHATLPYINLKVLVSSRSVICHARLLYINLKVLVSSWSVTCHARLFYINLKVLVSSRSVICHARLPYINFKVLVSSRSVIFHARLLYFNFKVLVSSRSVIIIICCFFLLLYSMFRLYLYLKFGRYKTYLEY